jgi:uncharacterized protein (TIGR00730 family)
MAAADDRVVTVFGSGDPAPGSDAYEQARAVGRVLAELGYAVANGGYGGTMEASARGAVEAGGRTLGVTCSAWRSRPNRYVQRVIATEDLRRRVATLVELGRAGYVVLPGGTGTLAELAWVWERLCKGLLPRRPFVCVGEFWQPLIDLIRAARPGSAACVARVDAPDGLAEHFPPGGVQD